MPSSIDFTVIAQAIQGLFTVLALVYGAGKMSGVARAVSDSTNSTLHQLMETLKELGNAQRAMAEAQERMTNRLNLMDQESRHRYETTLRALDGLPGAIASGLLDDFKETRHDLRNAIQAAVRDLKEKQ